MYSWLWLVKLEMNSTKKKSWAYWWGKADRNLLKTLAGQGSFHTCRGQLKPVLHNYWAYALEPIAHSCWSLHTRACALQLERPPQWEARAPQLETAWARQRRPNAAKNND